ncbi:DUF2790 domain-containing protein [Pseudomonas entomophila]|uniref:DUF2790 domain-containing protein n=1 Tax=Pseudomonas entomophila TaxID=312306 RepID=UPI0023D8B6B8|nr:DUF2790 domain-containing protein [Pseudomonas entomophila]MDF0732051.1 DUF2790 domain-containing protein [Pseudomonas entomophila]
MNLSKTLAFTTLLALSLTANAQTDISAINARLEQAARDATARYAQRLNKPMPELKDYTYDMNLDIAKVVHASQPVRYCGNVQSLMSYEDTQGSLHWVRYLVSGTCNINT